MAAGAEVNDAIAKCLAAQGKTDLRIRQIADLRSAVASTQQLMHNSGATYLEVLTAQQSLLSAELLQVNDRYDYIDGLISLYRALGGGE
jgi:outer membrane protein TolC